MKVFSSYSYDWQRLEAFEEMRPFLNWEINQATPETCWPSEMEDVKRAGNPWSSAGPQRGEKLPERTETQEVNGRRSYMRKRFLLWIALVGAVPLWGAVEAATAGTMSQNVAETKAVAINAVPNGTHFLVRLNDELNTGKHKVNKKFEAKTLDPLETSNGHVIPPGAKIRGHISRIEPAGLTGRARIWLTFDDIDTHHGRLPLVAEVSSVPGDFGVKQGESKEGEIEARTSKGTRDLEAAGAGAAIGAAVGATHGGKGAAAGAALGGVAGFVASSGFGQELDLPKGTKLDLVLDRPLYLDSIKNQ